LFYVQAEKQGVFISHITEERATALLLKDLLQRVFSQDLSIFVSSDYESIVGGEVWFTTIVNGLKSSSVIVVLLSPDSLERRWINFEAGVGVGANATVIPVLVHLLEKGEVGHPLTSLQIRSLQSLEDAHALLRDIGGKIGRIPKVVDCDPLVTFATQRMAGSGWVGVDWQGSFLAVEGPVLKLRKIDDQAYVETISDALKKGGFTPHLANRNYIGPSLAAGNKIVYLTDKKTYRAQITQLDVVLTAKRTPSS
jgi:hypothetical protein